MHVFTKGESVRIVYDGRSVDGIVSFASGNGRSLALAFDAMLGGYVGKMPVLWDEGEAAFFDLIAGKRVELVATSLAALRSEERPPS